MLKKLVHGVRCPLAREDSRSPKPRGQYWDKFGVLTTSSRVSWAHRSMSSAGPGMPTVDDMSCAGHDPRQTRDLANLSGPCRGRFQTCPYTAA
jgi:hypothetical protein